MLNEINTIRINKKHILYSGVAVAFMVIVFSIICQITPFGDKTFLMYDMKRQYIDYYAYLRTILSGENNIFYSFSTTLGSGMIGFNAYYVSSPFLLVLSFFPREYLPAGVTIIIGIKLILASVLMDAFLQFFLLKENITVSLRDRKCLSVWIGAISWSFSSFLIAHSMNMMWMDVIILMPVFVWTIEKLIIQEKILPYIICLCCMLYLNYYISYQMLIFAALWIIARIVILKRDNPIRIISKAFLATFTAPLIDSVFLVPTALELANSPKDITQLGLQTVGNNRSVLDILSKAVTLSYDNIEARFGFPEIFCGILFILLFLCYMLCHGIPLRERICMFFLLGFYMVSFCIDGVNLFMHAGMQPSGHPYRQAVAWIFIMVVLGVRFLLDDTRIDIRTAIAAFAGTAIMMICVLCSDYDHISTITRVVNPVILFIYGILFAVLLFKKNSRSHIIIILILVLQICDLSANAIYTYRWQAYNASSMSFFENTVKTTNETVGILKRMDDSFYRMENLTPKQENDSMQYGYNGVTHYSSAGMTYVRFLLDKLGYNDDTLYVNYGHDNTVAMDDLLGIKYVLNNGSVTVHDGYKLIIDSEVSAYQNPDALPVAIGTGYFDLTGTDSDMDPFSLQEDMWSRILNKPVKLFQDADVIPEPVTEENGNRNMNYHVRVNTSGELYFYLYGIDDKTQGLLIRLNGEDLTTYGNNACLKILNLGKYNAGDELELTVLGGSPEADFGEALFKTEDIQTLHEYAKEILARDTKVIKQSSSHLVITESGNDGLFLTIPCEKGWSVKIDGVKTDITDVYGALSYIEMPDDGAHIIDMRFVPEGFWPGLFMSITGIALFMCFGRLEVRKTRNDEK